MKRIILAAALSLLTLTVACSPAAQTVSEVSDASKADESTSGETLYSDEASSGISTESVPEADSEETSAETSAEVSGSSEAVASEADHSDETSDEASAESVVGDLFKQYYEILKSGTYMLKTVESRITGGESIPYTVTTYHKDNKIYAVIEESYGSISNYIIKNGNLIILDDLEKTAIIIGYSESLFSEKKLWTGDIFLEESGSQILYNTQYDYETYVDSAGFEFTLFFSGDTLKRYRSYDSKHKDTIVISLSISDDISGAVFDIPEGYTVNDTTK